MTVPDVASTSQLSKEKPRKRKHTDDASKQERKKERRSEKHTSKESRRSALPSDESSPKLGYLKSGEEVPAGHAALSVGKDASSRVGPVLGECMRGRKLAIVTMVLSLKASTGLAFPAMFADYEPPPSTSFTMYAAPNPDEQPSSGTTLSNRMILTGETDTMSYLGNNWLSPAAAPKSSDEDRVLARGYSGE